ncbi:MAG: hypothetical protein HDS93_02130 [Bacteroidales bacterium]|nr:hypothetical protein [Bacteroidales bacterium]
MQLNVIVTIALSVLAVFRPRSKFLCILFFIFMWSLWGFNLWNGDYVAYMSEYDMPTQDTIEIGYQSLCGLLSPWLPFQGFLIIVSAGILSFFCYCGIKYTHYPALYSLLYFPMFILEFVFLRNYISLTIIIYALFRIIYQNKSIWISIALVLIAATVHIFSIYFLPIILLLRVNFEYRSLIIVVIIGSILALVVSQTIMSSSGYLEGKAEYYARSGGNAISLTTPYHCVVVYIAYVIHSKAKVTSSSMSTCFNKFVKYIVLSLLFIPVYIVLPYAASRSLRMLVVMNIFYYLGLYFYSTKRTKIFSQLGLLFLLFSIAYMFSIQTFEYVLEPLYHCNLIWGIDLNYQLISY